MDYFLREIKMPGFFEIDSFMRRVSGYDFKKNKSTIPFFNCPNGITIKQMNDASINIKEKLDVHPDLQFGKGMCLLDALVNAGVIYRDLNRENEQLRLKKQDEFRAYTKGLGIREES